MYNEGILDFTNRDNRLKKKTVTMHNKDKTLALQTLFNTGRNNENYLNFL